jgi:Adenylate and Guanylate cyclase catalytic domain
MRAAREDVGGMAVDLAARVMSEAKAGEIIVSSTVNDLVVGSGIEFEARGTHALKGIRGHWALFGVQDNAGNLRRPSAELVPPRPDRNEHLVRASPGAHLASCAPRSAPFDVTHEARRDRLAPVRFHEARNRTALLLGLGPRDRAPLQ